MGASFLAGMYEHMHNFCKRRAEYLCHSFVIVHTEASFIREKLAYLAEVSVMEQILQKISKLPEILGKLSMRKQCVPGFFSPPTHALEPGNEATSCHAP